MTVRILTVIGTRPEAVKMAPVIAELASQPGMESMVAATAQHRHLLDQVLSVFNIQTDYDLDVMEEDQSPTDVLAQVLLRIEPVLHELKPNWVLVQGDTTTVLATALAASYSQINVGHVEAGLRTYDRQNPFPEEINRVLTDHTAILHFAPTEMACQALLKEGIPSANIHLTGNTVIDALQTIIARTPSSVMETLPSFPADKRLLLVTAHRRENFGTPLENIIGALLELSQRDDLQIVYPVHPNPNVQAPVTEKLADIHDIHLLPPLDYLTFVHLMKRSDLILTDSGGIQEEATGLKVPVLVMRTVTERYEAIESGTAILVGTDTGRIVAETNRLLDDPNAYKAMVNAPNPFGDGKAAARIVKVISQACAQGLY